MHTTTEGGDGMRHHNDPIEKYEDKILTVKDVRRIFGYGLRQAYEMVHMPGFSRVKVGRRYYISAQALEKWMDDNSGK